MSQRLEFANALRGIAAFTVVIAHLFGVFWYARDLAGAAANTTVPSVEAVPIPALVQWLNAVPIIWGPFGVALFFLISGFVIPFSFRKASAAQFLVGRIFRIYPLYMAGFAMTILALWISGAASGRSFPYPGAEVLAGFLPGMRELAGARSIDGVVWTLEVELKFYVLCALLATLIRKGSRWVFLVPVALAALSIMTVSVLSFASMYMLFMFIGVAMHYRYAGHIGRIEAGLLAVLIAAAFWKASTMSGNPEIVTRSYMAALVAFLAAFLVGKHWPRMRVLSFLADISYPLYVVHGVAGYALMAHLLSHGVNPYLVLVMVTAAAIGMAWVLHVLVEIPAQRLGHRLAARLQDKPAADIEFQKTA